MILANDSSICMLMLLNTNKIGGYDSGRAISRMCAHEPYEIA